MALGAGHQEWELDGSKAVDFNEGGISLLSLRSTGSTVDFNCIFAIVNGIEA